MAPEAAQRLASVVEPGRLPAVGDILPVLWQWAYFPDLAPLGALGPDGHQVRHDAWASTFPGRMAGGGEIRRLAPFRIGAPAVRRSRVTRAEPHHGRFGELIVCDWQHSYVQDGQIVLEETQTLIYRASDAPALPTVADVRPAAPPKPALGQEEWVWARRLELGPIILFRFSAATWNAHRIHYDREWATSVERYPGLVVHGPLLAILAAQDAERMIGPPTSLRFRARRPVFDIDAVDIFTRSTMADHCQVEVRKQDGTVAMTLSASSGSE
jgi:hydroxyacyl-ACP dehydratase HTD2-like protein with hotdog domain